MILIIKHIDIEGPGTLGDFLISNNLKLKIIDLQKGALLPDINECEAIFSLGGPMNVYEENKYPFLKDEDLFLKKAISQEIPILGICLGAQLLAKALGAKVKKASHKEIGWHKINLTQEGRQDALFENMPQGLEVFQWHEDTFDIPEGAMHLARSKVCPNQAFRFGRNTYGLQFHIEVTPPMIESWINTYAKDMTIDSKKANEGVFRKHADTLYFNFYSIISAPQKLNVN